MNPDCALCNIIEGHTTCGCMKYQLDVYPNLPTIEVPKRNIYVQLIDTMSPVPIYDDSKSDDMKDITKQPDLITVATAYKFVIKKGKIPVNDKQNNGFV